MTSPLDELLCFAVYSAANATTQAYRQVLAPWELTYTQFIALVALDGGERTVSALGEELGLDSGTVSPLVRRLELRGLVTRRRDAHDERVVTVAVSAEGRRVHRAIAEAVGCLVPAFRVDADEAAALIRALRGVTAGMRELTGTLRAS